MLFAHSPYLVIKGVLDTTVSLYVVRQYDNDDDDEYMHVLVRIEAGWYI